MLIINFPGKRLKECIKCSHVKHTYSEVSFKKNYNNIGKIICFYETEVIHLHFCWMVCLDLISYALASITRMRSAL